MRGAIQGPFIAPMEGMLCLPATEWLVWSPLRAEFGLTGPLSGPGAPEHRVGDRAAFMGQS